MVWDLDSQVTKIQIVHFAADIQKKLKTMLNKPVMRMKRENRNGIFSLLSMLAHKYSPMHLLPLTTEI